MNDYAYTVRDSKTNEEYPNLVGVFSREFPMAVHDVNGKPEKSVTVTYYGELFKIIGKQQLTRGAFGLPHERGERMFKDIIVRDLTDTEKAEIGKIAHEKRQKVSEIARILLRLGLKYYRETEPVRPRTEPEITDKRANFGNA